MNAYPAFTARTTDHAIEAQVTRVTGPYVSSEGTNRSAEADDMRTPLDDVWLRILDRIQTTSEGCWVWQGATNNGGYGVVGVGKKRTALVHRVAVLAQGREIPEGWHVDHSCHSSILCRGLTNCPHRRCVNPAHLVVMTPAANNRRKFEDGTCRNGHPYSERANGRKRCHTCEAEYAARRRQEVTA